MIGIQKGVFLGLSGCIYTFQICETMLFFERERDSGKPEVNIKVKYVVLHKANFAILIWDNYDDDNYFDRKND